jgi:hypothetical protein
MTTCKHDLNGLCTVSTCPDPTVFCNATERVVFTEELIAENARQQSENKRLLTRISEQDQLIGRLDGNVEGLSRQLAVEKDKLAENMVWREQMKKDHCALLERNIATNGEIGRLQAEAGAMLRVVEAAKKLQKHFNKALAEYETEAK